MFSAAIKSGAAATTPTDPQFNYVTMLLHGDGTNGGQNNTFLDSSTNNFTITRNGNTTQGSFSPYGANWSNCFNGSTAYLTAASNTAFAFGTGDWTIECWVFVANTSNQMIFVDLRGASSTTLAPLLYMTNTGVVNYYTGGAVQITGSAITANTWNHLAVARSGTSTKLFINGSQAGSTYSDSNNYVQQPVYIARASDTAGSYVNGYMSNVRLVKGTAVYTSAFTPSTTPLTAVSGTSLLTCQSNRFIDNSSNNFALTVNGSPSVQRFSPFAPSTAYSTATIGGSGYFDGSGDYLTAPNNTANQLGSGDFTIQFWAYFTTVVGSGVATLLSKRLTGATISDFVFATVNGVMGFYASSNVVSWDLSAGGNLGSPTVGQWYHYVAVRSGSNVSVYVNGVRTGNGSFGTASLTNSTNAVAIGGDQGSNYFTGYIEDIQIVKGTALYSPSNTTITIPSAPLTNVTNTSLLLNMTNGAIYDNAMMNDLETVGNAQISTSVKKYGTGSLAFDGNGDWLSSRTTPDLNMGTGNFTIECWVYINSYPGSYPLIIGNNNGSFSAGALALTAQNSTSGGSNKISLSVYDINSGAVTLAASSTNSFSTWYHVALVRNGTTLTLYRDGTSVASTTISSGIVFDWGKNGNLIGGGNWDGANSYYNGYIDDLRITKGYARYTANFTPPTQAFPNN